MTADRPEVTEEVSGYYLAKTPLKNKGISFSHEERATLGLRGLFPAGEPLTLERKIETAMENFRGKVCGLVVSLCNTDLNTNKNLKSYFSRCSNVFNIN